MEYGDVDEGSGVSFEFEHDLSFKTNEERVFEQKTFKIVLLVPRYCPS